MPTDKPAHVQLRDTDLKSTDVKVSEDIPVEVNDVLQNHPFDTAGQRDAAREILRLWEATHANFSEIARQTDWSTSHIREVYDEFFERYEYSGQYDESDDVDRESEYRKIYREAYSDGYEDGFREGVRVQDLIEDAVDERT